jgi:hypothetical protein
MAALESAVAVNFGIREAPLYHVVHAQVGCLSHAHITLIRAHRPNTPGWRSLTPAKWTPTVQAAGMAHAGQPHADHPVVAGGMCSAFTRCHASRRIFPRCAMPHRETSAGACCQRAPGGGAPGAAAGGSAGHQGRVAPTYAALRLRKRPASHRACAPRARPFIGALLGCALAPQGETPARRPTTETAQSPPAGAGGGPRGAGRARTVDGGAARAPGAPGP